MPTCFTRDILLLFVVAAAFPAFGQFNNTIDNPDTTRTFFPVTYGTKKWKPVVELDANHSFYHSRIVKINGLRVGAQYLGTHRFGVGYYWLNRGGLPVDLPIEIPGSSPDTSLVNVRIFYGTLFYERVLLKNKRWELDIPTHFGVGGIKDDPGASDPHLIYNPSFFSIHSGFKVKFYIFSWLAPHVGLHYRYLFNSEPEIRKAFSAPFYSFGVKVIIGDLYRTIFKPKDN